MALVLGLLVATAAAFAVTENLKLTKSPIWRTRVVAPDQLNRRRAAALASFSPVCRCRTGGVALQFTLRHADTLTLDVVGTGGGSVLQMLDAKRETAGRHTFVWFGRTGEGTVPPDGTYQFQVKLADARRTILLPNRVRVDTTPPRVLGARPNHPDFSPDGDRQADSVRIRYTLSEPGHAVLFLRDRQVVKTKSGKQAGSFVWGGIRNGVPMPQGMYRLRVGAIDLAGNASGPKHGVAVVVVQIRYITLARHQIPAIAARTRFGVGVQTGAPVYTWRFAGRNGSSSERVLVLRSPRKPGVYRLVVSEGGHSDTAFVEVVRRS
jgi:FlgD Ig-like domain